MDSNLNTGLNVSHLMRYVAQEAGTDLIYSIPTWASGTNEIDEVFPQSVKFILVYTMWFDVPTGGTLTDNLGQILIEPRAATRLFIPLNIVIRGNRLKLTWNTSTDTRFSVNYQTVTINED